MNWRKSPGHRRARLLTMLAALAGIVPAPLCVAQAVQFSPNYVHSPQIHHLLHWEHFPIRVFLAANNDAEKQAGRTTRAGFDEWVHATKGIIRYVVVTDPAQADITVCFNSACSLPGQSGVYGRTEVTYEETTLQKVSIGLTLGEESDEFLQSAAAHEFGHALGIEGHSDNADDLMYAVLFQEILNTSPFPPPPQPVTTRDLNTLKTCYPNLFSPSCDLH